VIGARVDFLLFQRFQKTFAAPVGGGRQLHRMVTLPIPTSR
jgi:hypothetical protein